MNKLYFFTGNDEDAGVFLGAKTWREARNMAIGHPCADDCEFIEIRGSLCRESGKPCYTEVNGEMECHEILATGYTSFWWSGYCEKCGEDHERLSPVDGKLICSECENPEEVDNNENQP